MLWETVSPDRDQRVSGSRHLAVIGWSGEGEDTSGTYQLVVIFTIGGGGVKRDHYTLIT